MALDDVVKILIGCQSALLGMFIWHLFKCRDTRVDISSIKQSLAIIQHEIGDHERGMRGELHQHSNFLTRHDMDITVLKSRTGVER